MEIIKKIKAWTKQLLLDNKTLLKRVHGDEVELIDGLYIFNNKKFSGSLYRNWPNGNKMYETDILDGLDYGKCFMYKIDGSLFGMSSYNNGIISKIGRDIELSFSEYYDNVINNWKND